MRTCPWCVSPPLVRNEQPVSTGAAPQNQHKHFNMLLNDLKTGAAPRPPGSTEVSYTHLHLVDSFYPASDNEREREKIRVTRDERTGEVLETLRKVRLADMNVHCPKRAVDWRISVNVEVPGLCLCFR